MKKDKLIILVTVIATLILGSVGYFVWHQQAKKTDQPTAAVQTDAQRFKAEYPGVGDDNKFVYATAEQVIDLLETGKGLVYLGFPECPWCQQYVIYLDEVAREQNFNKIYYYNVRQIRTDNTAEYQRMVTLLGDRLDKDDSGQPRIFVPDVTAVRDGEIVGHDNTSALNGSADGTPASWWTDERVAKLKAELVEMIQQANLCVDVCDI